MLSSGGTVRLRGPERLHLRIRLRLRTVQVEQPRGQWEAQTAAYEYRLSDGDDREILAYHWHPAGASHIQTPHRHLGPGAEVGHAALTTAHLPSGRIEVDEVVRLAIEGMGTAPVRRDWERVLRQPALTL